MFVSWRSSGGGRWRAGLEGGAANAAGAATPRPTSANVAHVGVGEGGMPNFGATDPGDVQTRLVRQLVSNLSYDFYSTWQKQ